MKMKQTLLGMALTASLMAPAAALAVPVSAADVLSVNGQNLWSQSDRKSVV